MKNMGGVLMKGQLTKKYLCGCVFTNEKKLEKYSKVQEQKEISEGVNELYSDDFLSTWSRLAISVQDIQLDVAEQDYLNGQFD